RTARKELTSGHSLGPASPCFPEDATCRCLRGLGRRLAERGVEPTADQFPGSRPPPSAARLSRAASGTIAASKSTMRRPVSSGLTDCAPSTTRTRSDSFNSGVWRYLPARGSFRRLVEPEGEVAYVQRTLTYIKGISAQRRDSSAGKI